MEKNAEVFRKIDGYEGYFDVSNYGNIKSLYRKTNHNHIVYEKILTPQDNIDGYNIITLTKDNVHKTFRVNILVAKAFIPNPYNLPEVNHKDENKHNNFVYVNPDGTIDPEKSNLEWCTSSQNKQNGTWKERGLETKNERKRCNAEKPVLQYTLDNEFVAEYKSINEAARQTGFKAQSISRCCLGQRNKYKNYKWKFKK